MKKLLFIVILFISIFIISGCGHNMIGNYKIVEVREGSTIITGKDLNNKNFNYSLKVNKNKTDILKTEEKIRIKYNDKYFYSIDDSSDRILYKYENNKIILDIDNLKLVFKK